MIVRCALVQEGVVVNVIMADPEQYQPEGFQVVASETANIGDTFSDGVFTPPVEEPQ